MGRVSNKVVINMEEVKYKANNLGVSAFIKYYEKLLRDSIFYYENNLSNVIELINYLDEYLMINSDIDRKSINKRFRKIYDEIYRKMEIADNKSYADLEKMIKELDLVYDKFNNEESCFFDFVDYVINGSTNINYLACIFNDSKKLVNLKNREGDSLFKLIILKYLDAIEKMDKEKILYYNNILVLLGVQENLFVDEKDRNSLINNTYLLIDKLKKKDKDFKEKKFWAESLVTFLKNEKIKSDEKDRLLENIGKKYNIAITTPTDILENVNISKVSDTERYIIDDYIISIDDSNTKAVDDAISCRRLENGNYLLSVHIADLLGYYDFDSKIVQDAILKTMPIFVKGMIRIPIISDDIRDKISLLPGKVRFARSYIFEIDKDKEIVNKKVVKSIITNNNKLNHFNVKKALNNYDYNPMLRITLENIYNALDMGHDGTSIKSADFVGACATFVNKNVSNYFYNSNYPCIYLGKELDESFNIDKVIKKLEKCENGFDPHEYKSLMKHSSLGSTYDYFYLYDNDNLINTKHYTTVTSPLRKGSDILVNHAVDVCYFNNPSDKELYKLEDVLREKALYMNEKCENIECFIRELEYNKEKVNNNKIYKKKMNYRNKVY